MTEGRSSPRMRSPFFVLFVALLCAPSGPSGVNSRPVNFPKLDFERPKWVETAPGVLAILLSAPRRSPAVPNPDGKLALFTKSTYSFSTHSRANEVCLLDIAAGDVSTLSSDTSANEPKWLSDGTVVVWLKQTDNNNTSFIISDAASPGKTYSAGTVSGLVSNLKVYAVQAGEVAIAVSGQANPDGNLFNGKDQPKSHSSAKLYKSGFVRHWDRYLTAERNAIFTAVLKKSGSHVTGREGLYHLVGFKNALLGTGLECPMPPFGGTDHFDIGRKGLVFVAKDPDLNPATHTKCDCYYLPRQDPMDLKIPQPVKLETRGLEGAATSPTFSPDGNSIVVLQMKEDGYESDRNYVCFYHDLDRSQTSKADHVESSLFTHALGESWDRSPNSIQWAMDSRSVFMTAEDEGFNCIFELTFNQVRPKPRKLTSTGNIISFAPLSQVSPLLLVSSNSLISNSTYYILSPSDSTPCPKPISPWSTFSNPSPFSLSSSQVSSIHFPGSNKDTTIHAFVLKPFNFNPSHTYPLAYLIHGGPQGAWTDSWSTRWNPALFAEQGYIVVCPNPTGSTGYGQFFTDAIARDWGGAPYQDLVNGMDYLSTSPDHKYIDMSRAVALGASYGGYMINYLQGQPLGRRFAALVCHDGVFSLPASQSSTEELYFPAHDMGGAFSSPLPGVRETYDAFDPARHTQHWATPQLTIHSSKDYRLCVSEGLAAFNTCQLRGVESMFLTFPDENHWVLNPENSLVWHRVVLGWCNRFVGLGVVRDDAGRDVLEGYCVGGLREEEVGLERGGGES